MRLALPVILIIVAFASLFLMVLLGPGLPLLHTPAVLPVPR